MTADHGAWAFDHRTATRDEILARASLMQGRTLRELAGGALTPLISGSRTRGDVGAIVEAWFGITPNSVAAADFPGAGIELKTVPLSGSGVGQTVKERTVLSMVDYDALTTETWATASVRHKLDRILLVYYQWAAGVDIHDFRVVLTTLWSPDVRQLAFMELDWLTVQEKVIRGEAHLISEGDGLILGAATKGADATTVRSQPYSPEPAKQRAWALKQSFTRTLYMELRTRVDFETLTDTLQVRRAAIFEQAILQHYQRFVGRSVGDVAHELGVRPGGKQYAARVARAAVGQRHPEKGIREFAELGIEVKIVRTDAAGMLYESMSFPAFRYRELIEEEWEDSDLLARLKRLLILPMVGPKGQAATDGCVLREPFFWSPDPEQLAGIRAEWEMYRDLIRDGRAANLPTSKQTRYIHVRPKAANRLDTDDAPVVGPVVRKCLWLNRSFIAELLRTH
jgi:DNA mismatch repair endonuclease MutH